MGFPAGLEAVLSQRLGLEKPTNFHSLAMPLVLSEQSCFLVGPHGNGKLLSYALPLLMRTWMQEAALSFDFHEDDPFAVICVENTEKADEIADFLHWFAQKVAKAMQWPKLRIKAGTVMKCHIAVCTP
jgi:superfamily II DNA/RNA helicase